MPRILKKSTRASRASRRQELEDDDGDIDEGSSQPNLSKRCLRGLTYVLVVLTPTLTLLTIIWENKHILQLPMGELKVMVLGGDINSTISTTLSNAIASSTSATFTTTGTTPSTTQPHVVSYFDLQDAVYKMSQQPDELKPSIKQRRTHSAYNRATVVKTSTPWFTKRKLCQASCCVETVAISLQQDDSNIIKNRDGFDLADLMVPNKQTTGTDYIQYHASRLQTQMLPCLVPGTVITIDNHRRLWLEFFDQQRKFIKVPYVLLTTCSDGNAPDRMIAQYMADPLLLQWYGSNPKHTLQNANFQRHKSKFKAFNLGLSSVHEQENYLWPYLKLTNFTNPFQDKSKFSLATVDFEKDVYVQFGTRRPHRQQLWNVLCNNTSSTATTTTSTTTNSCRNSNTEKVPPHHIYADMSRYRFGISPPGLGYDCYRTYEMLLLGVIPIVEERNPESYQLFEGLPVIHMANLSEATSKQAFVQVIQDYLQSDAFRSTSFEAGWQRLFLRHRRRRILAATGRDQEILTDEQGNEYYQAYHYTVVNDNNYAMGGGGDEGKDNFQTVMDWVTKWEKLQQKS
ncbi:expressed unknown protein [Seminavis robusta]|uniref:Exostosin GT47 domain-containing protein n=1 Tax=Seminavis robusta TaxID=568900 RepID=A0A9N8E3M2_9STRA|nr:expressed unknown protein [Seminavis robusta]|eukprot:Sro619_g176520.1 n/a (570) ;mRNA; r:47854-49563